jgi:hypothetical protein
MLAPPRMDGCTVRTGYIAVAQGKILWDGSRHGSERATRRLRDSHTGSETLGHGVRSCCERRLNTPQMCRLNFPQVS